MMASIEQEKTENPWLTGRDSTVRLRRGIYPGNRPARPAPRLPLSNNLAPTHRPPTARKTGKPKPIKGDGTGDTPPATAVATTLFTVWTRTLVESRSCDPGVSS